MHSKKHIPIISFIILGFLTGCGLDFLGESDAPPLPGERISVLELSQNLEPDREALDAQGFIAPPLWKNEFWPQAGGYPNHAMQNLALSEDALKKVWQADIGEGEKKDLPLTAHPIIAAGKIFTLDTRTKITAFDIQNGKQIWRTDIKAEGEDDLVISGGLSFSGGILYATNGYNEVLALDPEDGKVYWRVTIPAPSRAAPTVINGRVFVTMLNNSLVALNAKTGELEWQHTGFQEGTGIVGAASPAANQDIVVPGYSSGEVYALRVENGSVAWSDNLAGVRRFGGLETLADIRGMPIIDQGLIFAVSFGGQMVAIDEPTGNRIWQKQIASAETPWIAGNHIFVLSSSNQLVAMSRETGTIRWVTQLAQYEDEEDKDDPVFWKGPVLAGNRLLVAGSHGILAEINPDTGEMIRATNLGKKIVSAPVIAGGTLYLISRDGTLLAFQ